MNDGEGIIWGDNTWGQISRCDCLRNIDPNITISSIEETVAGLTGNNAVSIRFSQQSGLKPVKMDGGDAYNCMLLNDGRIFAWGEWEGGGLSGGATACDIFYDMVNKYPGVRFVDMSAGAGLYNLAAITATGAIGIITTPDSPGDILYDYDNDAGLTGSFKNYTFKSIESSEDHIIGILSNDKVYCAGNVVNPNYNWPTANPYHANSDSVIHSYLDDFGIPNGQIQQTFIKVSAGQNFSAGILSDGSPYTWGLNSSQLTLPPGKYKTLDCGAGNIVWVSESGGVTCSGVNTLLFKQIPTGIQNVNSVATGDFNNIALDKNHKVWCWGGAFIGDFGGDSALRLTFSGTTLATAIPSRLKT
jgi:alpha-tubulin suppressor-like RCC1 family protein